MVQAWLIPLTGLTYFSPSMRWMMLHQPYNDVGKSSRPDLVMYTSVRFNRSLITTRRGILHGGILGITFLSSPPAVLAANLPHTTGADLKRTGSIDTLRPIIAIELSLVNAKLYLTKSNIVISPELCTTLLLNSKGELINLIDEVLMSLQSYLQLSPVDDLDEERRLQ